MDGSNQDFPAATYERIWPGRWRDWQLLAVLLVLALAIRGWSVWQTEVAARDSIGFIRYALALESHDWREVICNNHQHPGYPLTILVMSWPVRWLAGGVNPYSMQYSAQLASALAAVLMVIPLFYLGKRLYGRGVGFWAALLFQCLPGSGAILSDGVSDPLFLCLAATALWSGAQALSGNAPWHFALCGVCTGVTYLVRPEGALVTMAMLLVLFGMQFVPQWRRPRRTAWTCAGTLLAAALATGSPYFLVTGTFTLKPSINIMAGEKMDAETEDWDDSQADAGRAGLPRVEPGATGRGPLFAIYLNRHAPRMTRMMMAGRAVALEFAHVYQYILWLPALVGLWWCRDRFRLLPSAWLLLAVFVLHTVLIWLLAVRVGYLSDRHVMVLVLCSIFQVVAVIVQLPYRLASWLRTWASHTVPSGWRRLQVPAAVCAVLLLVTFSAMGLCSKSGRPLHVNRIGHRAAGRWLAEHSEPADKIDDDHCWAHYYAGRVFLEGKPAPRPAGYRPATYAVVSRAHERHVGASTPSTYTEEKLIQQGAKVVYHWPERAKLADAEVVLYQLREK